MRLRVTALIIVLAFGFLVPLAAETQPAGKVPRIGYLMERPRHAAFDEAFLQGLRDLGYVEGQNITIEYRWAEGRAERLPALAAELVVLKVDAIVTAGTPATLAAKQATTTIPIVMATSPNAVADGLVATPRGVRQARSAGKRGEESDRGSGSGGELRIPGL